MLHGLWVRLGGPLYQPVSLDERFALLVCQRANCLQVLIQIYGIVVESFFHNAHRIFKRCNLAVELDQFLGKRVRRADVLFNIVYINLRRILAFIYDFLKLLVLLSQPHHIAINRCESVLEVIDLVVKNFIVSVDGHLTVNQGIHAISHLVEVLSVQLFKLLNQDLGCGSAASHVHLLLRLLLLKLILRLLLLLLLLLLLVCSSDLLIAPC